MGFFSNTLLSILVITCILYGGYKHSLNNFLYQVKPHTALVEQYHLAKQSYKNSQGEPVELILEQRPKLLSSFSGYSSALDRIENLNPNKKEYLDVSAKAKETIINSIGSTASAPKNEVIQNPKVALLDRKDLEKIDKIQDQLSVQQFSNAKINVVETNSEIKISTFEALIGETTYASINEFEMRTLFSAGQERYFSEKGQINFKNKLRKLMNGVYVELSAKESISTWTNVAVERGIIEQKIPLFNREDFERKFEKYLPPGKSASILVDLDYRTESVSIDAHFTKMLYLDSSFKVVKDSDDYRYIIFLGVIPGNTLVRYKYFDGNFYDKISFVPEEGVLYELNEYIPRPYIALELFQDFPLGRKASPLDLLEREMVKFNSTVSPTKEGINKYLLKTNQSLLGERTYIELTHLRDPVFLGVDESKRAHIPSSEYIKSILAEFSLTELGAFCLTQVNIMENIESFDYEYRSASGPENAELLVIDDEGYIYEEMVANARRIFFLGRNQGIINLGVTYKDQSREFLKTYCSEKTYLIEQL